MGAMLDGFLTAMSLIAAIGAQNAYLLRVGLTRHHVGLAVGICIASDMVLIFAGVGIIDALIRTSTAVLEIVRWVGVAYLIGFALFSFYRATKSEVLIPPHDATTSRRIVALAMLSFTFLNPQVYLDTVLLLGSVGNQYGSLRWAFALGAVLGSVVWFSVLGFGARAASRLMSQAVTWRILDGAIGVVMLLVALNVATLQLHH